MPETHLSPARDSRLARTWAEVDVAALARNARLLKRRTTVLCAMGDAIAVVKADAYGHGLVPVARVCAAAGVTHFAVAAVTEAQELRRAGIRDAIYLLSAFLPEEAPEIVRADLIPFVSSREQAEALREAASDAPFPARAFLTVDTGMGREGCLPGEARALWRDYSVHPTLRFTGIATHFSSADEDEWQTPTSAQAAVFADFLASLGSDAFRHADDGRGGTGVFLSLCNSPASLRLPPPVNLPGGTRGVLYRMGLLLYGIAPYPGAINSETETRPILSWKARIILLRDLPTGATLGYGATHTLLRPSRIATIAAGYADGVPRRLSNAGYVLYQGRRFPVVGRVSMDQFQIDLTDAASPCVGDIVILIGSDGSETQTAHNIAVQIKTTPHEPTCALTRRVPRVYVSSANDWK